MAAFVEASASVFVVVAIAFVEASACVSVVVVSVAAGVGVMSTPSGLIEEVVLSLIFPNNDYNEYLI